MRTSRPTDADPRRRGEHGLTLLEILVVLAIIGVVSSVLVLGLGGAASSPSAHAEARRLAASIQLASEDALMTGRSVALNWDADGYSFVVRNSDAWAPYDAAALGERHALPAETSLASDSEALPLPISENAPFAVTLTAASQSWVVRFDGVNTVVMPAAGG